MKKLLMVWCLAVMMLAASQVANASVIYYFTSDHCTGGCIPAGTATAGTVTLDQVGGNVTVSVQLTLPGSYFVTTGAGDDMYFKFNGAPSLASITSISGSTPMSAYQSATPLSFCGDGGGCFTWGIGPTTYLNGNNPDGNLLSFTVVGSTIAALTQPNNLGQIFVADIFGDGVTGLVDVSGPPSVPDGGTTISLLGLAMLGLGCARRLKR